MSFQVFPKLSGFPKELCQKTTQRHYQVNRMVGIEDRGGIRKVGCCLWPKRKVP